MMNKPVYKISTNSQTEVDGSTKEYVRVYNGGFDQFNKALDELNSTTKSWNDNGYETSLYYITFLSAKDKEPMSYSFEVDFIKVTEKETVDA